MRSKTEIVSRYGNITLSHELIALMGESAANLSERAEGEVAFDAAIVTEYREDDVPHRVLILFTTEGVFATSSPTFVAGFETIQSFAEAHNLRCSSVILEYKKSSKGRKFAVCKQGMLTTAEGEVI